MGLRAGSEFCARVLASVVRALACGAVHAGVVVVLNAGDASVSLIDGMAV